MTSVRVVFSVARHLERVRSSTDNGRCKVGGALIKDGLAAVILSGSAICRTLSFVCLFVCLYGNSC